MQKRPALISIAKGKFNTAYKSIAYICLNTNEVDLSKYKNIEYIIRNSCTIFYRNDIYQKIEIYEDLLLSILKMLEWSFDHIPYVSLYSITLVYLNTWDYDY